MEMLGMAGDALLIVLDPGRLAILFAAVLIGLAIGLIPFPSAQRRKICRTTTASSSLTTRTTPPDSRRTLSYPNTRPPVTCPARAFRCMAS